MSERDSGGYIINKLTASQLAESYRINQSTVEYPQIQMRDYKAVRPDKFFPSLPSIMRNEEAKKKGITEEERALATLSETLGGRF